MTVKEMMAEILRRDDIKQEDVLMVQVGHRVVPADYLLPLDTTRSLNGQEPAKLVIVSKTL